jgi:hypothetical protein
VLQACPYSLVTVLLTVMHTLYKLLGDSWPRSIVIEFMFDWKFEKVTMFESTTVQVIAYAERFSITLLALLRMTALNN